jgi:hypothetical protein
MTETAGSDFVEVRFEPDADGTGKFKVVAQAGGFAGRSGAWFNTESLADFAALLASYPLPDDPPPRLAGGFWSPDHPGELKEELVVLEAERMGSLGQVALRVHLASEIWPPDRPERRHEVRLELLTTYERLHRFSEEVLQVIRGESDHARLEGELMSGSRAAYT